jgi:hypothetical protein
MSVERGGEMMRTFITLRPIQYYDIFKRTKVNVTEDTVVGYTVARSIIIPANESSLEEDYANGLLSNDEYIDVLISKGFIKEVV